MTTGTAPRAKPRVLELRQLNIPPELCKIDAWVGWKYILREGQWNKIPVDLKTGVLAKSDDPATWTSFKYAIANYRRLGCDGIGLCRTADLIFLDLDGVLDPAGNIREFPWAKPILEAVKGRAYIERSPSGTGLHAICRGTLPPGRRQFDEPNQKHTGVALYDAARYFTCSGVILPESGPISDLTTELAQIHAALFPRAPRNGVGPRPPLNLGDSELLEKAFSAANGHNFLQLWRGEWEGKYASQSEADMALCCHLAFWTGRDASRIDSLFRQSGLYREDKWEQRDDYRERTIQAAIAQTVDVYEPGRDRTNGVNRVNGVALASELYSAGSAEEPRREHGESADDRPRHHGDAGAPEANSVVSVVQPTGAEGVGEPPHSSATNWPDLLKEEALYGLAGEWVRMVSPHTEADEAALLIQFLAAFGNVVGRGPYAVGDGARHFTNLFTVIVGQTSKARKGTSWSHARAAFQDIDSEWCASRVMGGLSSGEGLIWNVRDEIRELVPVKEKGQSRREEQVTDPGVKDKRLLVVEPEFASVLQRAERETNTLSAVIRMGWDSGNLQVLTKKQAATATNAHISLVGHITRDELRRLLSSTEAANGFANRFLWVCARRTKCLPHGGRLAHVDFSSLTLRLQNAVKCARTVERMEQDSAAYVIWENVYPELSEGQPGLFGAVTTRAEAQVLRLSCVYALLDRSAVVRAEHLMAALAVWEYCEASARFIFGNALGDATADEILRALRACPEGMTRNEIREYFSRNKPTAEIGRALSALQEYGRTRVVREETGGRPTERWFAI